MDDSTIDRRRFLSVAGAATAGLALAACAKPRAIGSPSTSSNGRRLPIGFSTLGTPKWDWIHTLDFAAAHGFAAVELRGIQETMDLSQRPEFQPGRLAQTKRELVDRGLVVPCLGASINMHEQDPAKLASAMAETRRFIDLASAMGTPYVRVFGNNWVKGMSREAVLAYVAKTLSELLRLADSPAVALLWDAHHTFVGGESPEATVAQLGRYIRHTHLKDSVPAGNDRRYVLTGTGEVPVRRQVEALARIGYRGYYSFEWEKRWHPEIEEPEVSIPQYATVMEEYLRGAGVTAR